ncbi:hypothetical protein LDENG_00119340 [Lucifuga dentata]|nr:hypothetical protein LDENG_00119340 [Lucifuga dentata]
MPACGNLQSNDILKQIMAESNMSDLFVQPPFPQPLFQSRCVPFGAAEHLPGSSVIQHTENVQVKREDRSCSKGLYPQPRVDAFAAPEFPGTLLSQILRENSCAALTRSVPTNHVTAREVLSDGYRSETTSQTPDTHPHPVKQIRLPDAQLSPASTNSKRGETQDIKKILREQILAGDFQRRNNSCLTGNTDPNASIKGPMSLGPLSSLPKVPGLHQISQGAKSVIMSASSDEMEGLLRSKSFTCFREASVPQHEVRSPASIEATDVDSGPALSFASQQPWMMEIQSAFERLDLVREKSDQTSPFGRNNSNNLQSETVSPKVSSQNSALSALFKPFTCESQNCTFSSMSGDSLWRHLSKTHNYTNEMVNVVKKRYQQYAPFRCQKCNKTFTRNSNLRTHYLSAHKLSLEEIADLDIKRKLATSAIIQNQSGNSINPVSAPHSSNENRVTVKREYPLPAFLQYSSTGVTKQKVQDNYCSTVRPPSQTAPRHSQASAAKAQSSTLALQSQQADGTAAERWSDGPQTPPSKVATQHVGLQQFGAHLSKAATVVSQDSPAVPPSAEKPSAMRQTVKLNSDITKKTKDRKPDTDNAFSPYRPYRCVHQGCVAAFTIQRNLILHYRAVHQSALSALVQSEGPDEYKDHDEEDTEVDAPQASEFRCQEKDCSGVFQEVLSLLQHYLQLHEFSLERAGALLSSINLGKFACGHQGCTASFTTFWKYVGHVKEQHQDIKLSKVEPLNGTFKCNIEGCDRAYATKSNLLRHVVKKHRDVHQPKRIKRQMMEDGVKQNSKNCHYQIIKTSNGKENIESNKKIPQRGSEMKRISKRKRNHWITYGKPSLKSQEEAAAMCTKAFPLQYPCMIEGCESVMNSERNITKHYVGHGLTEKYLEEQRSHFIFCKKFPSKKYCSIRSDDSKSDNTSDLSENEIKAGLEGSKYRYSKPDLRKKTAAVFDESSEPGSDSSMVVKRKRGRPRKLEEKIVKRKKIPRSTKNHVVYSRDDESDSSCPAFLQEEKSERSVPLASFKPMGFEMSFLKFLEQSKNSEYPMKKFEMPETVRKTASSSCTCVQFSNRQNVKSLCKVKIVVDEAFSGVAELTLKQLQDLRPTVVLEKNDFNNLRSRMT